MSTVPFLYLDFINKIYWFNGAYVPLSTVLVQNPSAGGGSIVVDSAGLRVDPILDSPDYSNPVFTAALIAVWQNALSNAGGFAGAVKYTNFSEQNADYGSSIWGLSTAELPYLQMSDLYVPTPPTSATQFNYWDIFGTSDDTTNLGTENTITFSYETSVNLYMSVNGRATVSGFEDEAFNFTIATGGFGNPEADPDTNHLSVALFALYDVVPPEDLPAFGIPGPPSRHRAWSFVLDGHTFYVLDLGAESTFCYDITTQQWSNFTTADYGQWDVAQGCMWGTRIVGGDVATGDIWEVTGSALSDQNDNYDIEHVVSGAVAARSRVYHSVAAVRLAVSKGIYDDPSSTAMNLRWSDDGGQSWSDYYTDSLTEGQTYGELAWRSLGAFNAPGRIFEFSDLGGPVRIDGCDAFIDNFDDDTPQDQPAPQQKG